MTPSNTSPSRPDSSTASARSSTALSTWWPSWSARAITAGSVAIRLLNVVGNGVAVGHGEGPGDDVAVGEAAQRSGGVHVGGGDRRVPRSRRVGVRLVRRRPAGATHGEQEGRGTRVVTRERAFEAASDSSAGQSRWNAVAV